MARSGARVVLSASLALLVALGGVGCSPPIPRLGPQGHRAWVRTQGGETYTGELLAADRRVVLRLDHEASVHGRYSVIGIPPDQVKVVSVKWYPNHRWKGSILAFEVLPAALMGIAAASVDGSGVVVFLVLAAPAALNAMIFAANTPPKTQLLMPSVGDLSRLQPYARFPQGLRPEYVRHILADSPQDSIYFVPPGVATQELDVPEATVALEIDPGPSALELDEMAYLADDGFWIDKYEVRVKQYRKFARSTERAMPPLPRWGWVEEHPVVNVTWEDANAYCSWVGKRLPTENEWLNACQGTNVRKYPWGNSRPDGTRGNYTRSDDGYEELAPVGSYSAGMSPNGVWDMAGNVWEWTASAGGNGYVLHGGSWADHSAYLRCGFRLTEKPYHRLSIIGFRCVRK